MKSSTFLACILPSIISFISSTASASSAIKSFLFLKRSSSSRSFCICSHSFMGSCTALFRPFVSVIYCKFMVLFLINCRSLFYFWCPKYYTQVFDLVDKCKCSKNITLTILSYLLQLWQYTNNINNPTFGVLRLSVCLTACLFALMYFMDLHQSSGLFMAQLIINMSYRYWWYSAIDMQTERILLFRRWIREYSLRSYILYISIIISFFLKKGKSISPSP